jgi:hypothetical protein
MPLIYLTHLGPWTVYDLWSDANTEQAVVVDVPESLIARWQTVKNEFSAVQRVLHDLYHDALSQRHPRAPTPTDAPAAVKGAVMPFFHFDPVQLLDLLHDLEWVAHDGPEPWTLVVRCPICAGHEPDHVDDCRLAAMIAQVTADLAQFKASAE